MRWAYDSEGLIRIPVRCASNGYYLRWYYNGWHYWFFLPGVHTVETEGERYRTLSTRTITVSSGQITRGQAVAIRTIMNTREVYMWTDGGWAAIRIEPGSLKIYQSEIAGTEMEITAVIGSREVTRTTGFSPVPPVTPVVPTYPWCEVDIVVADQVWMCKNYDIAFPGSRVYDGDEDNRAIYGGLYTHSHIMTPGFCPSGWHVPTMAEWNTLIAACGGAAAAGGVLKEIGTTRWNAPNTGAVDTYGFTMPSTGFFRPVINYQNLNEQAFMWATDGVIRFDYDSAGLTLSAVTPVGIFYGVRLIRDTPPSPPVFFPARYGYLYNWWAANNAPVIAAPGWHVPLMYDHKELLLYLDPTGDSMTNIAGGKMKETGLTYWNNPNNGATNEVGFNARGGGNRIAGGAFSLLKYQCYFWNGDFEPLALGDISWLRHDEEGFTTSDDWYFFSANKYYGVSLRLVKDSTTLTHGQTGTYTGNDGKVYRTICIGNQEWLADNLCETLYRDGSPIPEVTNGAAWAALTTGARCSYDNDESNAHD